MRGLKGQEISLMGSVALHELYFGNLGGFRRAGPNSGLGRPDWHEVPDTFTAEIAAEFGRAARNIHGIDVLPIQGINVYDILRCDTLVLSKAAVAALEERFNGRA